ncbi:MAG TPA: YdeI/OmpD-associated family protein, partial [Pyrinomonadaceae bacterium]|nr:YdeI/OmpD-associated family protein [Pyrinomonadaceae bacterium]
VPPELVEVLDQDPAAKKLFESLTNGRRRVIVWHVDKVKDTDERICRALIILEHVKNNCGEIDDKKLYEELKAGRAADRRT